MDANKLLKSLISGLSFDEQIKLQTKIIGQAAYCKTIINKHLLN